jgi:LacI family transcriptional regulator
MALGALKSLHELGVSVPGDVSVVGYDNMHYDDYCIPPLSSVHPPVLEMAQASVQMLLDQILGAGPAALPTQQVFPAGLVVRESSLRAGAAIDGDPAHSVGAAALVARAGGRPAAPVPGWG